ncbi:hypothetical protein, partial [Bacteroides heparinolyticus]|uniref:hypothetical protein n=1 Tax=Prevotella heparinolytica TaxID=28113 RepID=UPI0035A17451
RHGHKHATYNYQEETKTFFHNQSNLIYETNIYKKLSNREEMLTFLFIPLSYKPRKRRRSMAQMTSVFHIIGFMGNKPENMPFMQKKRSEKNNES